MKTSIISKIPRIPRISKMSIKSIISTMSIISLLVSCAIEPPLRLPQQDVMINLPIVIADLEAIWDIDAEWKTDWWYGWDEADINEWGPLAYPEPTYYEVRRFYQGETLSDKHSLEDAFTIYTNTFRRRYNFGYYDLLIWSNIDSKDGTQVLLVNEDDIENIIATTTKTSTSYGVANAATPTKNQPEVFYADNERNFFISRNPADYDYFDEQENTYVKRLKATLDPRVYIYLVQVVIYNNNGKITGMADNATLTGMANAVNINNGQTSKTEADIVFGLRFKRGLKAREGKPADILGGKLTTFGLCDMPPWKKPADNNYNGSRTDLENKLHLNLQFSNTTNSVFHYDLTKQLRSQTHGGLLTIEIDADTITVPTTGTGAGFKPTVEDYKDSITHEFEIKD